MTDRRLRITAFVLCAIGLAIASYLTYVHYAHLKPLCLSSGGCEIVQTSRYATFAGIPVATLGLFGYIMILISLFLPGDLGRGSGALLALVGFGFSAYLTWLELARIHAICQWCVASAIVMTLLAIVTMVRLWIYEPPVTTPADSASSS